MPLFSTLAEGLERAGAETVVDLSDEPVVSPRDRMAIASERARRRASRTSAPTSASNPCRSRRFRCPSLAVIGSGKRVGKTAVAGHVARLLSESRSVVVVAMGRGGPAEPIVAAEPPDVNDLLELARSGSHAASDYLEDAALARVPTVGCRRAGGGLAGAPFISNVEEGARLAAEMNPDLVIFEGSGAALPPIDVARAGARRRRSAGSRDRRRLPRRVPDPRLRPRRPHRLRGAARHRRAGRRACARRSAP